MKEFIVSPVALAWGCISLFLALPHFCILLVFIPALTDRSLESVLRHAGDDRTQIRELGQTSIDGGTLDELISEKLEAFSSCYEQLNKQLSNADRCKRYQEKLNADPVRKAEQLLHRRQQYQRRKLRNANQDAGGQSHAAAAAGSKQEEAVMQEERAAFEQTADQTSARSSRDKPESAAEMAGGGGVQAADPALKNPKHVLFSTTVEMKNDISLLKNELQSSQLEHLEPQNGKDSVQEVATLRRSLDDAEGLSRDTEKDRAVLHRQNMALEETNVGEENRNQNKTHTLLQNIRSVQASLTASHEKMEVEVNSLRRQLEAERSRHNKMQSDLQKELHVGFDENTELTSLLHGRVPKNPADSVEPERTVANLNKELAASCDTVGTLRAQLDQLASLQNLPDKVNSLMKQVSELTEELCAVRTHRDALLSSQTHIQEETARLRDSLQASQQQVLKLQEDGHAAALREQDLSQQRVHATEQLHLLRSDLERSHAEKSRLTASAEESRLRLDESDRQRASLEEELQEVQQLMKDLEDELADSEASRSTEEEISKELQEQISFMQERLHLQEQCNLQQRRQREAQLHREIQQLKTQQEHAAGELLQLQGDLKDKMQTVEQLEEELKTLRQSQTGAEAEAEASQQLLSEAKTTISALREQLSGLAQSTEASKEATTGELSSPLEDSTQKLQEFFREFQHFIRISSEYNAAVLDRAFGAEQLDLASLPESTVKAYSAVCEMHQQTVHSLGLYNERLQRCAQGYRKLLEELVKKDLAVFEEWRLQDVLLCRVQAPSHSLKDQDFQNLWKHRVCGLLDQRQLYLQKMSRVLEKLWADMESFTSQLAAEICERGRFKGQLQAVCSSPPIDFRKLDGVLSCELNRRPALAASTETPPQGSRHEHDGLSEEFRLLLTQADCLLREERSRSSALLQTLEDAPPTSQPDLLKDNQQLLLRLQQAEDRLKALRVHVEQLEEAQKKASSTISSLQTELEDTRAQVKDKDSAIQSLKSKLHKSQKNASVSAAELQSLQPKLSKMEAAMTSAATECQQEIRTLSRLLRDRKESLRGLEEQQSEESILQGEDLHARWTSPRGLVTDSSVLLEKTKLVEEVQQLHPQINELQSSASSQQEGIAKWKSTASKLREKNRGQVDRLLSPRTPTKRTRSVTADTLSSPERFLGTPKNILSSPRSSWSCPRSSWNVNRSLSPALPRADAVTPSLLITAASE